MNAVRQFCPMACNCMFSFGQHGMCGAFGTPSYGCPTQCNLYKSLVRDFLYVGGFEDPCVDLSDADWVGARSGDPRFMQVSTYILGLSQLLASDPSLPKQATSFLRSFGSDWNGGVTLSEGQIQMAIASLRDGSTAHNITEGEWLIAKGIPHPRGLTGCLFLSSWEVQAVWQMDLCALKEALPIHSICPESCKCKDVDHSECPRTCMRPNRTVSPDLMNTIMYQVVRR